MLRLKLNFKESRANRSLKDLSVLDSKLRYIFSFALQVRTTLKMLEDDLEAHMRRNCTLLENNVCVQM